MAQVTIDEALALAAECRQAGRFDQAQAIYQQVVAAYPQAGAAWMAWGEMLRDLGRDQQAIGVLERVIGIEPEHAGALNELGLALLAVGRLDEAGRVLERLRELAPELPEVWVNLGNVAKARGRFEEAAGQYRRAIELRSDFALAWNNLANVLKELGKTDEALAGYERAVAIEPNYAEACSNCGAMLGELRRLDEAARWLERAIQLQPALAEAMFNLVPVYQQIGRLADAVALTRRAMELRPESTVMHSALCYQLPFVPGVSPEEMLAEGRRYDQRHGTGLAQKKHSNDRDPKRRLRVGYVSPDFRDHCQSFFTLPLLSHHDRKRFEIFCYSDVLREDTITTRIRGCVDVWRETARMNHEQLARTIHDDRIDILIDLTMHMAGNRLPVFARKPAPVQISWLAYPGTTGLEAIDYRITDVHLDPPGTDARYSEKSLRLPTFWCYDPLTDGPAVNELPASSNGHITFGCLNNFQKINDNVLTLWSRVLQKVPGSRLILLCEPGRHREKVLIQLGVEANRVEFVSFVPRAQYLRNYHRIDLCLDTFPYNGHTTSLDACWMGVPVVTLAGNTVVSRGGLSQLTNLGLTNLIAQTPEQFIEIATILANDPQQLASLRSGLRQRMKSSILMDTPAFARSLKAAYIQAWQAWCATADSR